MEKKIEGAGFWDEPQAAQAILKKRASLKSRIGSLAELEAEAEEIELMADLAQQEADESVLAQLSLQGGRLRQKVADFELKTILSSEDDSKNAIVAIHPGAGGTESQDWAQMLLRMYIRWAEIKGFGSELIDLQPGEEAGIKSATLLVRGDYACGFLKAEMGVHRLVRISPFDASRRRHTSFASVFVYPEVEDEVKIELDEGDLKIETFRSSGAGGQHVNVTDSAVRITHIPTGIVVQCQNQRSQHKNKATAMKVLRSRLYDLERKKLAEKLQAVHSQKKEIAWGSQIRSYILQPYRLIKDHRTGLEVGNVDSVLDGDIDLFIRAYLLGESDNRQA